tara:strand:+ start:572 stop:1201 length:630 start_codon:yes stop_codon:yes gene_type:complete
MSKYNKYIFTGIMSIIPIAITYWIIENLFLYFSKPGKFLIDQLYKIEIFKSYSFINNFYDYLAYLIGFILTILFLYILGQIVSNVLGKRIYIFFEGILSKIPIVNKIYSTIKQITNTFTKPNNQAFQKVVMLEYPKENLWTLAMVTGECINESKVRCYKLFVPTTPNPTSGYLIIVDKKKVVESDISVEEGLSIIISGGMVSPEKFNFK